jgi:hypothetical protein
MIITSITVLSANRITLGRHKSDNNNQRNQLTEVFCVLLRYKGQAISDYNKRLILLLVIQSKIIFFFQLNQKKNPTKVCLISSKFPFVLKS